MRLTTLDWSTTQHAHDQETVCVKCVPLPNLHTCMSPEDSMMKLHAWIVLCKDYVANSLTASDDSSGEIYAIED